MKKTLVMVLAIVAAFSMFCSTAFAGSVQGAITPVVWDGFEFNLRKADSANVVKDGKIGVNEYDEIKIDNEKMVFVNYTVPDSDFDWDSFKELAEDLKKSMRVFVSWDETNGFNAAIQYHVPANQVKCENTADGSETFLFSKLGGVLFQIRNNAECTPLDDPDGSWDAAGIWGGNVIYDQVGYNTATNTLLHCLYQAGYGLKDGAGYTVDEANYAFSYDEATETVTVEASYPLNQVIRTDDPDHIYFAPQAMRGQTKTGDWGQALANACFGQTGFYVKQEIVTNQRCMTLVKVDEAVGYVEPEPTPTPEPTPEPAPAAANNTILYVIMAVEGVAIIALIIAMVMKKK